MNERLHCNCADLAGRVAELEGQVAQLARAGAGAEWASQATAARLAGVAASTVRAWQRSGLLARGRRGRVNVPELRQVLAAGERPRQVADLGAVRARRAAAEILARPGG